MAPAWYFFCVEKKGGKRLCDVIVGCLQNRGGGWWKANRGGECWHKNGRVNTSAQKTHELQYEIIHISSSKTITAQEVLGYLSDWTFGVSLLPQKIRWVSSNFMLGAGRAIGTLGKGAPKCQRSPKMQAEQHPWKMIQIECDMKNIPGISFTEKMWFFFIRKYNFVILA